MGLEVATGQLAHAFTGHTRDIGQMALSRDGRTLATAGPDGTVRLWDVPDGRRLHTFTDLADDDPDHPTGT